MNMNKVSSLLLLLPLLELTGCVQTTLVTLKPDPATGQMTKTTYTSSYDAGVWLTPKHLGMSVVVDQLDSETGNITVYVWNRDQAQHSVKIRSISRGDQKIALVRSEILAKGDDRTGLEVGKMRVLNFGTSIEIEVGYELDGLLERTALHLERRTPEDIERYFGKNGKPPYPWYHD
jgi:hypothetical protein